MAITQTIPTITQTVTTLPNAPSRLTDPKNFASEADALMNALPILVTEENTVKTQINTLSTAINTFTTQANTLATDANTSATNASTSETNSANSATSSAASATASAASATNSATSATNSATSATASATSATNSTNSATASASSATSANNSANSATSSATSATNSANSATVSETNSANSATASASSATASASSATQASATANVTKWISSTAYLQGTNVWSPISLQTYRAKVNTSGTTDPSVDTTNWLVLTGGVIDHNLLINIGTKTHTQLETDISNKQNTLVSGTNIKSINSTTLLGSGDLEVQPTLVSGTNIKTIGGTSILGNGDITIQTSSTLGTLTKTFVANEDANILLSSNTPTASIAVTKEVPQLAVATNDWNLANSANDFSYFNYAYSTTLTPSATTGNITLTLGTGAFTTTDIGKTIYINGGTVLLTSIDGAGTVTKTLLTTNQALSGTWTMHEIMMDADFIALMDKSITAKNYYNYNYIGLNTSVYSYNNWMPVMGSYGDEYCVVSSPRIQSSSITNLDVKFFNRDGGIKASTIFTYADSSNCIVSIISVIGSSNGYTVFYSKKVATVTKIFYRHFNLDGTQIVTETIVNTNGTTTAVQEASITINTDTNEIYIMSKVTGTVINTTGLSILGVDRVTFTAKTLSITTTSDTTSYIGYSNGNIIYPDYIVANTGKIYYINTTTWAVSTPSTVDTDVTSSGLRDFVVTKDFVYYSYATTTSTTITKMMNLSSYAKTTIVTNTLDTNYSGILFKASFDPLDNDMIVCFYRWTSDVSSAHYVARAYLVTITSPTTSIIETIATFDMPQAPRIPCTSKIRLPDRIIYSTSYDESQRVLTNIPNTSRRQLFKQFAITDAITEFDILKTDDGAVFYIGSYAIDGTHRKVHIAKYANEKMDSILNYNSITITISQTLNEYLIYSTTTGYMIFVSNNTNTFYFSASSDLSTFGTIRNNTSLVTNKNPEIFDKVSDTTYVYFTPNTVAYLLDVTTGASTSLNSKILGYTVNAIYGVFSINGNIYIKFGDATSSNRIIILNGTTLNVIASNTPAQTMFLYRGVFADGSIIMADNAGTSYQIFTINMALTTTGAFQLTTKSCVFLVDTDKSLIHRFALYTNSAIDYYCIHSFSWNGFTISGSFTNLMSNIGNVSLNYDSNFNINSVVNLSDSFLIGYRNNINHIRIYKAMETNNESQYIESNVCLSQSSSAVAFGTDGYGMMVYKKANTISTTTYGVFIQKVDSSMNKIGTPMQIEAYYASPDNGSGLNISFYNNKYYICYYSTPDSRNIVKIVNNDFTLATGNTILDVVTAVTYKTTFLFMGGGFWAIIYGYGNDWHIQVFSNDTTAKLRRIDIGTTQAGVFGVVLDNNSVAISYLASTTTSNLVKYNQDMSLSVSSPQPISKLNTNYVIPAGIYKNTDGTVVIATVYSEFFKYDATLTSIIDAWQVNTYNNYNINAVNRVGNYILILSYQGTYYAKYVAEVLSLDMKLLGRISTYNISNTTNDSNPSIIIPYDDGTYYIHQYGRIITGKYVQKLGNYAVSTDYKSLISNTINTTYWTSITNNVFLEKLSGNSVYYAVSTDTSTFKIINTSNLFRSIVRNNVGIWQINTNTNYGNETWVSATINNKHKALEEAMTISVNMMLSTNFGSFTNLTLTNSLNLAVILKSATGTTTPTFYGVNLTYNGNVKNQYAVLGVDYTAYQYDGNSLNIKSLANNNLKVRIV